MQNRARSPDPGERSRGDGHLRHISGGRASRVALGLVITLLLPLGTWFFTRSGMPTSLARGGATAAEPSVSRSEGPPLAGIEAAAELSNRIPLVEPGSTDPPAVKVSRPQTLVFGSLLDPSHSPIRGTLSAGVSFVDDTGRRITCDATGDGEYALPALEFGKYWVTANADGYRRLEETIELRAEQPRMREDFKLQKAVALG